jgi:MFS family permease
MALFASFTGTLADRTDPGRIASFGMALSVISLLLLVFIDETTSLPYLIVCMIILGMGLAFFASPNTTAIMGSVERKFYSVASGTLGTMRLVGQMLSMGIATIILALFIGKVAITPDTYARFLSGMRVAFVIFAVLCIAGIVFSLIRGKVETIGE